ncbi:hypothetical protein [Paraburkholderia sp. SIMBA_030]|uniref:hypothetical protein n=1 Tax=Paraburkholderia sp. SIMBA_030 TaxID=3085773 RepID=UPI00397818DD
MTVVEQPLTIAAIEKTHRQVKTKSARRFILATDPANHFVCSGKSSVNLYGS